ncbi:succinate dehydrogenase assembly factor 2 [Propionivibrio limicola]|uniref:FAD assembly factor SdhE n=1 Tax=Propionivibrio limicola TaxID=167645 RepID=UPI0012909D52|nr:succinate dehydrogenase assembly factor 2 [Propionivibrio limicola]
MDTEKKLGRLRWKCTRRSMAEADYLLGSFLDKYYVGLNPAQTAAFEQLVEMEDLDLWALVSGRRECVNPVQAEVVSMLRNLKVA